MPVRVPAVVELRDSGVVARTGSTGRRVGPSRGCAVVEEDRLLIGSAAAARARLTPRRRNERFWELLDLSPLPHPFATESTHADLVHAHLTHFRELLLDARDSPDVRFDVVLAVPGFWSVEQLELLLGIAHAAELPVRALVDLAVAAGVTAELVTADGPVLYLDQHLHRTSVTLLERLDGELVRGEERSAQGTGRAQLEELWARHLAEIFVRRTRFDPLHLASAEQELFDGLPRWLAQVATAGGATVELESTGRTHSIELSANDCVQAASAPYREVLALVGRYDRDLPLVVAGDGPAGLPGLVEALEAASGRELVVLPTAAAATGGLAALPADVDTGDDPAFSGGLPLLDRLPLPGVRPRVEGPPESAPVRSGEG